MRAATFSLVLAIAVAANSTEGAKPQDRASFKPTSPWAIEYADQSCRLIRNFNDGQQAMTLAFERFIPGPGLRLGIAAPALRVGKWEKGIKFRYGPSGEHRDGQLLQTELVDGRKSWLIREAGLLYAFPPPKVPPTAYTWSSDEELAAAQKINSLTIDGRYADGMLVDIGPMEAPLKALQACMADLVTGWGLDMQRMIHATRLAKPINPPEKWIVSDDYPREMLAHGRTGIVGFRLVVDELGSVKKCFVDIDKPGPFEVATCNAVKKRARFNPALDAEGKPMPALFACSVRYIL